MLRLETFLTRNGQPHRSLDPATDSCARTLKDRFKIAEAQLPIVLCPGGQLLRNPSEAELARCIGLVKPIDPNMVYDTAIVGAGPAGLAAAVEHADRLIRGLRAAAVHRQHLGGGIERRSRALSLKAGADRMLIVHAPTRIGLRAERSSRPRGVLRDPVEQQVAQRIRRVGERADAIEQRDLKIDVVDMLLQRQYRELSHFVLILVQQRTVEVRGTVHRQAKARHLSRIVGNLILPGEPAGDQADPSVRIDDAGDIGQAMELVGCVVQRVEPRGRVLDADLVLQKIAGDEPIDRTEAAAIFETGLHPAALAAIHRHRQSGIGTAISTTPAV